MQNPNHDQGDAQSRAAQIAEQLAEQLAASPETEREALKRTINRIKAGFISSFDRALAQMGTGVNQEPVEAANALLCELPWFREACFNSPVVNRTVRDFVHRADVTGEWSRDELLLALVQNLLLENKALIEQSLELAKLSPPRPVIVPA